MWLVQGAWGANVLSSQSTISWQQSSKQVIQRSAQACVYVSSVLYWVMFLKKSWLLKVIRFHISIAGSSWEGGRIKRFGSTGSPFLHSTSYWERIKQQHFLQMGHALSRTSPHVWCPQMPLHLRFYLDLESFWYKKLTWVWRRTRKPQRMTSYWSLIDSLLQLRSGPLDGQLILQRSFNPV